MPAIVRPYAAKTAGIPLRFEYEMNTGTFTFEWANRHNKESGSGSARIADPPLRLSTPLISQETEIFLPSQITHSREIRVEGLEKGDRYLYDERRQTLFIVTADTGPGHRHKITVSLYPSLEATFEVNDLWSDFGGFFTAILLAVLSFLAFWVLLV